jgi:hypothetical protein
MQECNENLPKDEMPSTFSNSFKNSTAIVSGAGENIKILWITLVASNWNFEFEVPILIAIPKDWSDCCAVVHREIRYCAGVIERHNRFRMGFG